MREEGEKNVNVLVKTKERTRSSLSFIQQFGQKDLNSISQRQAAGCKILFSNFLKLSAHCVIDKGCAVSDFVSSIAVVDSEAPSFLGLGRNSWHS